MLNQIDKLERSVYVLPTQRWVATTISIPYAGSVTRETHVSRPLVVNTSQALWLTNNFFAFYVNSDGERVDDVSKALVAMAPDVEKDNLLGDDELTPMFPDAKEGETANSVPVETVVATSEAVVASEKEIAAPVKEIAPAKKIEALTVSTADSEEIPPTEVLDSVEKTKVEAPVEPTADSEEIPPTEVLDSVEKAKVEAPVEPTTAKKTAAKK